MADIRSPSRPSCPAWHGTNGSRSCWPHGCSRAACTYDTPDLRGEGGHLDVAFDLAERLRRVADPDTAAQIAASLRTAAEADPEA